MRKKVTPAHNLQIINPNLAEEWHPTKNGTLTPKDVAPNSCKKIWWKCRNGHEWQTSIIHRNYGQGCPYCSNRTVNKDNCLATINPILAKEWHPSKNGFSTSRDVVPGSGKKAWWLCKKGHEWEAVIASRNKGVGCPFCTNKAAHKDNCLATINPTLAKQWHPTKNGVLTPNDFTPGSESKVWWLCEKGHEWEAVIASRNSGVGCPYCSNKAVNEDNCLETLKPLLAKEWHSTKNGLLTPKDVTPGSEKRVWWLCKKGHEWRARVADRNKSRGCPYCHSSTSEMELRVYSELRYLFNNVSHRSKIYGVECDVYIPDLKFGIEIDGAYWHKDKLELDKRKNSFLFSKGVNLLRIRERGMGKISKHDIFYSKKEFPFDLMRKILSRISEMNLIKEYPTQNVKKYLKEGVLRNDEHYVRLLEMLPSPLPGTSLFDLNRELSKEWHPTNNGTLTPKDVTAQSQKEVWWLCKYHHSWQATVKNRNRGNGCPYCSNKAVNKDNCLATNNSALVEEWHPSKNGLLTPSDVTPNSSKKVWWKCKNGHEWRTSITERNKGSRCPYCSGRLATKDNCLQSANAILSKEWHPTKNGSLTPSDVTPNSGKTVWWLCKKGHEWQATIASRNKGGKKRQGLGCPFCGNQRVSEDNCLQSINSILAQQWHPSKNGLLTPRSVVPGSGRKAWWLCNKGHEWEARIDHRNKGIGCPYCSGKRKIK